MTDEKRILMPESLTAENGAKGLVSGEFEVSAELSCCDEDDCLLCVRTDTNNLIESVKNTIIGMLNTDPEYHDDMAEFCLQAIDKAVNQKLDKAFTEISKQGCFVSVHKKKCAEKIINELKNIQAKIRK